MHFPTRAELALGVLGAAVALPATTLARSSSKAKVGYYVDSGQDRNMTLFVTPDLKRLRLFQVACLNEAGRAGGTINVRSVPITSGGRFTIDGSVTVISSYSRFKTPMRITGTFQANRVVGSVTATGRSCGALRFNGRYYGDVEG